MPFTLILVRAALAAFVLLLVAALLQLTGLASALAMALVLTVLLGLPVFVLEALGLLNRLANWLFARRL